MNKKLIPSLHKIVFIIIVSTLVLACKKDHNVLGVDVQPAEDALNAEFIGDLAVTAHTLKFDSIVTFSDQYKYLGSHRDAYFGSTECGIYLNANLPTTNINFGNTASLLSAEIVLAVDNVAYMGDPTVPLTFSVYPLDSSLSVKQTYFTSITRLHNPVPMTYSYSTTFTDKPYGVPVIRIPLDFNFASQLFKDTASLVNNDVFLTKYKGFYIKTSFASGTEGVIYKADLGADVSGLYLHYKTGITPSDTVTDYKLVFTGASAVKINTVKFTPSTTLAKQINGDTALGSVNLFLGGMGLTKLKFEIPYLKYNPDSIPKAINRAEIIFNVDSKIQLGTGVGRYILPPKLVVLPLDSSGRETYDLDLLNSSDYLRYDGTYDATKNRYVFNIARQAQAIMSGKKKNYGFYLSVANADVVFTPLYYLNSKNLLLLRRDNYIERVVLVGSNDPVYKPKFNLTYIKFKQDK